ncbi:MAG: hypothetical protein DMF26_09620 [Verrucomicrobia bacterium]|nr:MAG: hypothetical protein DMF26_09620 [Verrucomicrobiota bacterium]
MMIVVIAATNLSSENRTMNARTADKIEFVYRVARFGFLLALGLLALSALFATAAPVKSDDRSNPNAIATETTSLNPPDKGQIPVAFLISDGAVVIDFCGPWEVFQDVMIPGREEMPFRLYTVAETKKPIRTSGGMQIVPDYTIQNAPPPKVIVIPAQSAPSPAVLEWIRKSSKNTDVTMSVCTGAFVLAKTGLLTGKSAAQARCALCRERKSRNRRRSVFRNRPRAARDRTLLRAPGCPKDGLQHGVPGRRLDESRFKSDVRHVTCLNCRAPALPGVRNGR